MLLCDGATAVEGCEEEEEEEEDGGGIVYFVIRFTKY
jgi:hypothetical protein